MTSATSTYLIRPVQPADVDGLLALVQKSSGGLSSLQPRYDFMSKYIKTSCESFAGQKPVTDVHKYLLVMIDLRNDMVIGCAAVKTQIGTRDPFINFDIKGYGAEQYIEASSRFTGATEVGSLFLHPDYRAEGIGRYLAKVRYMLIGSEPWRFGDTVVAELRGICGKEGSPLYDHLFAYKLDKSFLEADAEYFDRNPDALGDIVPIGRISTHDFPANVKASIGQTHESGKNAMRLLQSEGFLFSGTIDLFDAGPIMSVYRDTIRTILETQDMALTPVRALHGTSQALISTGKVNDFRAVVTDIEMDEQGGNIALEAWSALFETESEVPISEKRVSVWEKSFKSQKPVPAPRVTAQRTR